jgi:hypothetical protein
MAICDKELFGIAITGIAPTKRGSLLEVAVPPFL